MCSWKEEQSEAPSHRRSHGPPCPRDRPRGCAPPPPWLRPRPPARLLSPLSRALAGSEPAAHTEGRDSLLPGTGPWMLLGRMCFEFPHASRTRVCARAARVYACMLCHTMLCVYVCHTVYVTALCVVCTCEDVALCALCMCCVYVVLVCERCVVCTCAYAVLCVCVVCVLYVRCVYVCYMYIISCVMCVGV